MAVQLPTPPRPAPVQPTGWLWIILALQLLTLGGLALVLLVPRSSPRAPSADLPRRARGVASKLKAAGALAEAAGLYERYLDAMDPAAEGRAQIAFSLGKLLLEQGQYERALRWFYEAEAVGGGALEEDLGKKIVHCLEALGRIHAAKAVLSGRTQLGSPDTRRPESDPVVAKIDKDEIRRSDLQRALDDLPPYLKQRFGGEGALAEFLQKYVADELIYRKAKKLEYDKEPAVRRQLETLLKQLVISRFVEKEILAKLQITETELKNHHQANRARYDEPDRAQVQLIKVASEEKATALRGKLDRGATFAALAREASLHKETADKGGTLERWVSRGEDFLGEGDAPALAVAVFDTPAGKVSGPAQIGRHHYLFNVKQIKRGKQRSFAEVRKQVESDYRMRKTRDAYGDLIRKTLTAEEVKLFPEKLAGAGGEARKGARKGAKKGAK